MGVALSSSFLAASRGTPTTPAAEPHTPALGADVASLSPTPPPASLPGSRVVTPLERVTESPDLETLSHTQRKGEDSVSVDYALSRTASDRGMAATTAPVQVNEAPSALSCSDTPSFMSGEDSIRSAERRKTATQTSSRSGHSGHPALRLLTSDAIASPHGAGESNASFSVPMHSRRASRSLTTAPATVYGVDVVEIKSATPQLDGLQLNIDDFELAYSQGVQDGILSPASAAAESFAAVQYLRPVPRDAPRSGVAGLLGNSDHNASGNVPAAADFGVTYPPRYTPSEVDETLAFVTLRRAGFAVCRICATDLPYSANYCPECGTKVEESCTSPVTESQYASTCGSYISSPLASSPATAPHPHALHYPAQHLNSSMLSPTTRPGRTVEARLQESNVFTPRRGHAFVRYVKVLRSRDILGTGMTGTVYRAIDTRSGQQLAVKESLINQNSSEELGAVRNELHRLAELRHPYIIEYLGCRVEAVEDVYVTHFQSSLISSHPSAVDSRRASRRNSVAPPRAAKASRSASSCEDGAAALDAAAMAAVVLDLVDDGDVEEAVAAKSRSALSGVSPVQRRKSVTVSSTIRVLMLMERVECGTLAHLLHEFPRGVPEQAVRRFVAQLVDAVRYVHSCELSHRDIKPDNILLASDGTIRLSDFGCAVRGVDGLSGSKRHSVAGTPAYMPPESLTFDQSSSNWTSQGKAQDVWAIGCVVHHLITAEAPWSSMQHLSPYALMLHVQTHEFPLNAKRLSRDALDFCRRCFERDPQRRITASELASHPFVCHAQNKTCSTSSLRFSQMGW